MMKKRVMGTFIVITITLLVVFVFYKMYIDTLDMEYATEYSRVFGSCDINEVDSYFKESTVIESAKNSGTYKDLRNHIINAFRENRFVMPEGSSYGNGDNVFRQGIQTISVQSYVLFDGESIEIPITIELQRTGINMFEIKKISSSHQFFDYLFFGARNGV